ncbi:hypothetical protein [Ktedonobacter sp. SOSP1-52]|uniref:DUF3024 domain-containing protein n=1 Tax=Ktedonobacter sp. SOSP1-52 TaxID=2778366 RepID=UPI001915FD32|nr:hypothetical protein [Ktedonobacter sp. SOSP1-52]
MRKPPKSWMPSPRKTTSSTLPETLKQEVSTKANMLIETVLKARYIQPPPQKPQFNYVVDVYGKWYHSAFYFCATYHVPYPEAEVSHFEVKFARMRYAGSRLFDLAFMRYTGQWIEPYSAMTVDECLAAVRDDPFFTL